MVRKSNSRLSATISFLRQQQQMQENNVNALACTRSKAWKNADQTNDDHLGFWVETGIEGGGDYWVALGISLCHFTIYYGHHTNFIILKNIFKKNLLDFIMSSRVAVFPDIRPQ